jgi:hypothetical protein
MQLRRTKLDQLAEIDRPRFVAALVNRFAQALGEQFPEASGYKYSLGWGPAPCVIRRKYPVSVQETCRMASLRISRGPFWGLHVRVVPQDISLRRLKVTIDPYFPAIKNPVESLNRFFNQPSRAQWLHPVLAHLLLPILVIIAIALLPLMAAHQLAKLWLRGNARAAARQLDSIWPQMQSFSPARFALEGQSSPSFTLFMLAVLGTGATIGCFWLTGLVSISDKWRIVFQVAGGILGLISFGVLIGWIMSILGFEMEM